MQQLDRISQTDLPARAEKDRQVDERKQDQGRADTCHRNIE